MVHQHHSGFCMVQEYDVFHETLHIVCYVAGTLSDTLAKTQRQLEEARADNVSLYEKLRYMERYSQKAAQVRTRRSQGWVLCCLPCHFFVSICCIRQVLTVLSAQTAACWAQTDLGP
jgi:hypothetical protein